MTAKQIDDEDVAWTVQELATALQVHPKSVEASCRDNRLPSVKAIGHWRIPASVCRELVTATKPDLPRLSKTATRDLLEELEGRQNTEVVAVTFNEFGGPKIHGLLFEECGSGDFYRRQINHYLNLAHADRTRDPRRPTSIDPVPIFKYFPGMI